MPESPFLSASLDDLAVLEARGEDAADFLHGQLTQDIAGLTDGTARLAGYCTPKGRLLATLVVWRESSPDGPVLRALLKADLAQALLRRLTMFVLRAKVRLNLAAVPVLGRWRPGGAPDDTPPSAWTVRLEQDRSWIAAPAGPAGEPRWWCLPRAGASADHPALPSTASQADLTAEWQAAEALAGLAWIAQATQDLFLPQSLNLDLIGGLSFTKGCYPGQEVVARAHYRKAVKRRMALALVHCETPVTPAADIWRSAKPGLACGRVIAAAPAVAGQGGEVQTPTGSAEDPAQFVLMELALADWLADDLRLGEAQGPALRRCPLPYPVPADAA